MLTVEKCVDDLKMMGYLFSMRSDGAVSVKQPHARDPLAVEMMNFLALHREELRQHIRDMQPEQMQLTAEVLRMTGIPPDEAFSLGEAIKQGRALLVGNVIYHRPTGLFDITFIPMEGGEQNERQEERQPRRA